VKKTVKKKAKKKSLKYLKNKAKALQAEAVKLRDNNKCLICGEAYKSTGLALHCHHWYKMKGQSLLLQFEIDNGVSLCFTHHVGFQGVHRNSSAEFQNKYWDKINDKFGDGMKEKLRDFDMSGVRVNRVYLEEKIIELEGYIKNIEG